MFKFLSRAIGFTGYVIQYGCITHCTFEYLGDFVMCSGPSMEPTLFTNNILVTERISPRINKIQRGDIVIAKCPTDPQHQICKRVVGLPGDRIKAEPPMIFNHPINNIARNLEKFEDDVKTVLSDDKQKQFTAFKPKHEIIVPRGHVWIEGDNSKNSADSRYYGPVPQGLIKSRAVCRIWPLTDIKLL